MALGHALGIPVNNTVMGAQSRDQTDGVEGHVSTRGMKWGGYLSSQLFHQGLEFTEEVVPLVEERQVGVHEGQHLERQVDTHTHIRKVPWRTGLYKDVKKIGLFIQF